MAIACPIPELPPVTRATLPFSPFTVSSVWVALARARTRAGVIGRCQQGRRAAGTAGGSRHGSLSPVPARRYERAHATAGFAPGLTAPLARGDHHGRGFLIGVRSGER